MAKQPSIIVCQVFNKDYQQHSGGPSIDNPEFMYKVERTCNTLICYIGEYLPPARIQGFIDGNIDVTIQPIK